MDKLNLKNPQVISYLDDSKEELLARLLRREETETAEKEYRKERKYQNEKLAEYFESECRV